MQEQLSTSEFLSAEELEQMTECVQPRAQQRKLSQIGVSFIVSPSGRPLVGRLHIREKLGHSSRSHRRSEPYLGD